MMSNIISNLNKKLEAVKISNRCRRTKAAAAAACVYREDLKKRNQAPEMKKVKKRVRFADTEPVVITIEREETEEKVVRIRVKLTKEEANRMLSRCSDAGILEFGDVASQLMRIPPARLTSSILPN